MVIDVITLIVVAAGFWFGYSRGIIQTVFRYVSIFFGIMAALRFSPAMTNFLKDTFGSTSPLMFLAGFLLTLVLTILLLRLVGKGLETLLESVNINFINQLLGGVFSAAVSLLFYSALLWFVLNSSVRDVSTATLDSQTYPYLKDYPKMVWNMSTEMQPIVTDFWEYSKAIMDDVENVTEKVESGNQFFDIPDEQNTTTAKKKPIIN
jgi:membrane protein required for colicin V production